MRRFPCSTCCASHRPAWKLGFNEFWLQVKPGFGGALDHPGPTGKHVTQCSENFVHQPAGRCTRSHRRSCTANCSRPVLLAPTRAGHSDTRPRGAGTSALRLLNRQKARRSIEQPVSCPITYPRHGRAKLHTGLAQLRRRAYHVQHRRES